MSHDLDMTHGSAAMAYVGAVPWHGLGASLQPGQSIEEWVTAAQLGWTLQRLPVQYLVDGKLRALGNRFVLARSDTGDGLSVVSDSYNPVQPREVLEFYRQLVERHDYSLETAGALDGGRKVWALARTGLTANLGDDDEMLAYLLLATSCDKSLATTATFTSVRVVCQNTLAFAFQDKDRHRRRHVKVTHSSRFVAEEVHEQLGLITTAWADFQDQTRRMSERKLKDPEMLDFYDKLLRSNPEKPLSPTAQRERLTLATLFKSAPGQDTSSTKGTLWGAVNAVTYYVDHQRKRAASERLDSAWFGSGDALKEKAWTLAEAQVTA